MNIALITDGMYPYVMGGMQKHSYNLARFLARKGVSLHVVHCVSDEALLQAQPYDQHFTEQELSKLTFTTLPFPRLGRFPGHYLRENKHYSAQAFDLLRPQLSTFDFIYAQGFTGWKFLEERQAGRLSVPVGVNFHGYEMYQPAPSFRVKLEHFLLRPTTRRHNRLADVVFSFEGHIGKIIRALGVAEEQIVPIPLGIEAHWLEAHAVAPLSAQARRFVFVGRYERRKGIEELSVALKELLQGASQGFEVEFVGPIPEAKRLSHPQLTYHGAIKDPNQVQQVLRSCDVLLCPSFSEGMPTVILEAMASGLAIIATDVGAVAQQVHQNGWLLPRPQPSLIKQAMQEAMALDEASLQAMKDRSRAMIRERFLWERVAEQTLQSIQHILRQTTHAA